MAFHVRGVGGHEWQFYFMSFYKLVWKMFSSLTCIHWEPFIELVRGQQNCSVIRFCELGSGSVDPEAKRLIVTAFMIPMSLVAVLRLCSWKFRFIFDCGFKKLWKCCQNSQNRVDLGGHVFLRLWFLFVLGIQSSRAYSRCHKMKKGISSFCELATGLKSTTPHT